MTDEKLSHLPCPCGQSSDSFAYHQGKWWKCFSCDRNYKQEELNEMGYEVGEVQTTSKTVKKDLLKGEVQALKTRGISLDTCKKFSYQIGEHKGEKVQIANYCNSVGQVVAQKIRTKDKKFYWLGDKSKAGLYGQHLWGEGGKRLVITEGELDALSVSQAYGNNKWPTVSLNSGATSGIQNIKDNYEFVTSFDEIILMLDMDVQGREATKKIAEILPYGKCKIANLAGAKDANEALTSGMAGAIASAIFEAKSHRPDNIVAAADFGQAIHEEEQLLSSIPYQFLGLNDLTRGLRLREVVVLAAGSGIGKSSLVTQITLDLHQQGEVCGMLMLEEANLVTIKKLIGLHVGKTIENFHELTKKQKDVAFQELFAEKPLFLFDHFGSDSIDVITSRIRYMVQSLGVRWIILDHISILMSGLVTHDERKAIDIAMTTLRSLVQELNIGMIIVSHLSRPQGSLGHEDGKQVSTSELRGSHSLVQLADIVLALNKIPDEHNLREICVLKNRYNGQVGSAGILSYSRETGRLSEHTL